MVYNTTSQIMNVSQFATFNSGCYAEVNKCIEACTNFRVVLINTLQHRLIIGFIILLVLVFYQIYIKYQKPKYSQSEKYIKWIDKRIDFAIIVFFIALIGLTLM